MDENQTSQTAPTAHAAPAAPMRLTPSEVAPTAALEAMWKLSAQIAKSSMCPADFRGNPANVFLAADFATRTGIPLLSIMRLLYVREGNVGWKAEYVIGRLNDSGLIRGPIRYEVTKTDDNIAVQAFAEDAATGAIVTGYADLNMAKQAGWTRNKNYERIPEQMLRYRAATFLVRAHYPQVLFGLPVADEIDDVAAASAPREAHVIDLDEEPAQEEASDE